MDTKELTERRDLNVTTRPDILMGVIEAQAAEIERLEAELRAAQSDAEQSHRLWSEGLDRRNKTEAQLAAMQDALSSIELVCPHCSIENIYIQAIVEKALATDAGKAGAQVIAAARAYKRAMDLPVLPGPVVSARTEAVLSAGEAVCAAVDALNAKEGRDERSGEE